MDKDAQKPRLLLHACCAPCAVVPVFRLIGDYSLTLYFYNPNIDTVEEYEKRAAELYKIARYFGLPESSVIIAPYGHADFLKSALGLDGEKEGGERCGKCFELRLNAAAEKAAELDIPFFMTSLTLSPHKNAEKINALGKLAERKSNGRAVYLESDFKKKDGFKQSIDFCREIGVYRQNYCGCRKNPEV